MIRSGDSGLSPMMMHAMGGAALLALAAGAYVFVVLPTASGERSRGALKQRIQADGQRLASLQVTRDSLVERLERGQRRVDETGVSLLGLSGRNTRMSELTELAGECGLRLDSLQPGAAVPGEMFTITPISMRGVGSYSDVAGFLHLLVQRLPDVSARSFRLTAQGIGDERQAMFEFDLAWYADPADAAGRSGD